MATRKTATTRKTTATTENKPSTRTLKAASTTTDTDAAHIERQLYQAAKNSFVELGLNLKKKNRKYAVTIHDVDEVFNTPQDAIDWLQRNKEALLEELEESTEAPISEGLQQEQDTLEQDRDEPEAIVIDEFGIPILQNEDSGSNKSTAVLDEVQIEQVELTTDLSDDNVTGSTENTTIDIDSIKIPDGEPKEQFRKAFESVFQKKSEDFYRPDVQAAKNSDRPLVFDLAGVVKFLELELPTDASASPLIFVAAAKRGYTVRVENNTYSLT